MSRQDSTTIGVCVESATQLTCGHPISQLPCNSQPEDEEEEEKASMKHFLRDLEGQRQMQKK
jgi:hypothetical protein